MAKRKNKNVQKKVEKAAKKHPILVLVVILLVVALVGVCVLHKKGFVHIPFLDGIIPQDESQEDMITDDLQIHFLELGNSSPGGLHAD